LVEAVMTSALGSPPGAVAALARGVTVNGTNKSLMAAVLMVGLSAVGFGLGSSSFTSATPMLSDRPMSSSPGRPKPPDPVGDEKQKPPATRTLTARVLSPDNKPVSGASLFLIERDSTQPLGMSAGDGRFTAEVPAEGRWVYLVAHLTGHGVDFVRLDQLEGNEVELQLVKDNVIRGRIIDTEGKPIAGAHLVCDSINVYQGDSIESFLGLWKNRHYMDGIPSGAKHLGEPVPGLEARTDGQGRFALAGTGAERLISIKMQGGGIASDRFWVVNRNGFDPAPINEYVKNKIPRPYQSSALRFILRGPDLTIVGEKEKVLRGVVKDRDTGKPRAGATVWLSRQGGHLLRLPISTKTDDKGRYQLRGAHKTKYYTLEVESDPKGGYLPCQIDVDDTEGYSPVEVDLPAARGVVVTGRVIDKRTNKPLPGFAMAHVLTGNPFVEKYPEFDSSTWMRTDQTDEEGVFRTVTIPGPVILMGGPDYRHLPGGYPEWLKYKRAVPDPEYPDYFSKRDRSMFLSPGGGELLQGNSCKVLHIKQGVDEVVQDILVEPHDELRVQLQDGEGTALAGVHATGISPEDYYRPIACDTTECPAYGIQPEQPRLMVFHHEGRKLAGVIRLKGNEARPTVKLAPLGKVKGRLVDEQGKPLANVAVTLQFSERQADEMHEFIHRANPLHTDADGTFTIDNVLPGPAFSFYFQQGQDQYIEVKKRTNLMVEKSGGVLDVGKIVARRKSSEE
jgi:hypothetical protein